VALEKVAVPENNFSANCKIATTSIVFVFNVQF
jgi:hypothetical protein